MANKKLLSDFRQHSLTEQESLQIKGGRNYVPTSSGSYGYINWDDLDPRGDNGLVINPNENDAKPGFIKPFSK